MYFLPNLSVFKLMDAAVYPEDYFQYIIQVLSSVWSCEQGVG